MPIIKHLLIFTLTVLLSCSLFARGKDHALPTSEKGMLSLGMRSTISLFSGSHSSLGKGVGGHFRLRFSDRVNSQWFADYLLTNIEGKATRTDYHIGWSVMYYPIKALSTSERLIQPYVLGGHCFDRTEIRDLTSENIQSRWSSSAQMGIGNHFNLSNRFDLALEAQYMLHLGSDLHAHVEAESVSIERHEGIDLEGHFLVTISLNYKLARLW